MRKSQGNIVVPWDVIDRYGADALRWYFFTSKQPWDGYRFSLETIGEGVRQFLLQLWNTYSFFVLYANAPKGDGGEPTRAGEDLDRWARSRLAATVAEVRERLDDYDATTAGRAIAAFVDDLSNWYVRRSRPRFWRWRAGRVRDAARVPADGVAAARSLHPVRGRRDLRQPRRNRAERPSDGLPRARGARRAARVRHGDGARGGAPRPRGARAGQGQGPPAAARGDRRRGGPGARGDRAPRRGRARGAQRQVGCASSRRPTSSARYEVKPNFRALGPRFGKRMPQVAAAVAALDPSHVAAALREERPVGIAIDGHDHQLGADDLQLVDEAAGGLPARARGLARRGARTRRSTTSCGARAWRARSSTPCRPRAATPGWPSRTGSPHARRRRGAAGGRPRARGLLAGETLAVLGLLRRRAAGGGHGWNRRPRAADRGGAGVVATAARWAVSLKQRSSRRPSGSTTRRRDRDVLSACRNGEGPAGGRLATQLAITPPCTTAAATAPGPVASTTAARPAATRSAKRLHRLRVWNDVPALLRLRPEDDRVPVGGTDRAARRPPSRPDSTSRSSGTTTGSRPVDPASGAAVCAVRCSGVTNSPLSFSPASRSASA